MASRRSRPTLLPPAQVEYLILADAVEALGGKLYMMGGGWDTLTVRDIERAVTLSFACGVEVPWNATDDDHVLTVAIRTADAVDIAPPLSLAFRTGRPPSLDRGASLHLPFAVKGEFTFPAYGAYSIVATVDGGDGGRSFAFSVRGAGA